MNDILTKPPKQTRSTPLLQTQNEISQRPHPTNCKFPTHMYEGWNFNSGNYLFTTDTK